MVQDVGVHCLSNQHEDTPRINLTLTEQVGTPGWRVSTTYSMIKANTIGANISARNASMFIKEKTCLRPTNQCVTISLKRPSEWRCQKIIRTSWPSWCCQQLLLGLPHNNALPTSLNLFVLSSTKLLSPSKKACSSSFASGPDAVIWGDHLTAVSVADILPGGWGSISCSSRNLHWTPCSDLQSCFSQA